MSTALTLEQISTLQKANFDTNLKLANHFFNGLEKFSLLNISNARSNLTIYQEKSFKLPDIKGLEELITHQSLFIHPLLDQAISYNREAYAIFAETQEVFIKSTESWHVQLNQSVFSSLDSLPKLSNDSDVAVNAVKSAITAANSAFSNANKAVRQVASITEASVKAASAATTRALETAATSQASRKKAA